MRTIGKLAILSLLSLFLTASALLAADGGNAVGAAAGGGLFRAAAPESAVQDRYVVVLREHAAKLSLGREQAELPRVAAVAERLSRRYRFSVVKVWDRALRGFLIEAPEEAAQRLAMNPLVASVEQDASWRSGIDTSAPVGNCYRLDSYPYGSIYSRTPPAASPQAIACSESNPLLDSGGSGQTPLCRDNWGLDRIDQRASQRDGLYAFDRTGSTPGQVNVRIFLLDSGLNVSHREFLNAAGTASRATALNFTDYGPADGCSPPTEDPKGHGTHTAAIAAGRIFGVAKDATVVMLDVESNCVLPGGLVANSSPRSWVINALNQVAGQRPSVLSWSGGNDQEHTLQFSDVRAAVQGVVSSGVLVVQSAGNQSSPYPTPGIPTYPTSVENACSWSFGSLAGVLVVGGIDQSNNRWTRHWSGDVPEAHCNSTERDCGSNVGSCIDVWAPAANILSASGFDPYGYCRLSGTSMAAPHAAGVAALYLQAHPLASPAEVEAAIIASATTGLLNTNTSTPNHIGTGSPNRILYSRVP
jgi:subtilisin family serine protease